MNKYEGLTRQFKPDPDAFIANLLRRGTPARVHHIELFQDGEISEAIAARFDLLRGLDPKDGDYWRKRYIAIQRFCGFDYVKAGLIRMDMPLCGQVIEDTAGLRRKNGRRFQDETNGPIMSWEDFEKYPWPDPSRPEVYSEIEWYAKNAPDDMALIAGGGFGHFAEYLTWLMGYQTFCYSLYDQRELVRSIADKLLEISRCAVEHVLEIDRVKVVWGSDDMGHKTGLLFAPDDMREFVLSSHKFIAEMCHKAGRPYILHSCGNLRDVIDDLTDDVKIDGKHSFEDTIEDVREVKHTYGRKIALLGGIDVDFLCRADEQSIRRRVRETLDVCMPGGGYFLGTGNTVANYIPLDNYMAMVDEGRLYGQ